MTKTCCQDSYALWVKHCKGLESVLRAEKAGRGEREGEGGEWLCAWDIEALREVC